MRHTWMIALVISTSAAVAQTPSASTVGSGGSAGGSSTVGSGGSAAAGGTAASTLGLGASSGQSKSVVGGGSAAAVEGKVTSSNKLHTNGQGLQDQAKAKAQDGGTWSKSMTKTKVKDDQLTSRTKSMSHQPGGPPAKSTTTVTQ